MTQVGWIVRYLDDLESDLSVFHRVEDMYALPLDRFLRWASRIFAYGGAMAARLREEQSQRTPSSAAAPAAEVSDVEALRNAARRKAHPGCGEIKYVSVHDAMKLSA